MNFPFPEKSTDEVLQDNEGSLFSTQMSSEMSPYPSWLIDSAMQTCIQQMFILLQVRDRAGTGDTACALWKPVIYQKLKASIPAEFEGASVRRLDNC